MHYLVVPKDPLKMEEWMKSRADAEINPHQYTILLKHITINLKGGYIDGYNR